ncbi:MAG: prenyltransferase/squalene oxidase repeat-containing protein [Armatimonadota bacterium]|nr:prenyltransferase/squalene oxidase repeat-containing protein [Armatimonadota bacterium]
MGYLDLVDGILRSGAHGLGEGFIGPQAAWVEAQEAPGGGFPGREGPADLYYTDFALRALDLVAPQSAAFETTAKGFLGQIPAGIDNLLEAFSMLSIDRLLRRRSLVPRIDRGHLAEVVRRQSLSDGGFASCSGELSAYGTFLGSLCVQMLEQVAPDVPDPVPALQALQRPSGGYVERGDSDRAQTNATAAAAGVLLIRGGLEADAARGAADFVAGMQADDGGLRAHRDAPEGDLLSSFTGLLTLVMLGSLAALDLPALARFIRSAARPQGGFGASPSDAGADVEYTYYGIASLALMQSMVGEEG